ncbi:translation initiation factor [Olivibacter sp. SDN3]|uniref:translation initiation factor n=1 Tax=Olivibacter sp. SDN3 TaxID=2764720 RepID=UPI0016516BA2|nr:translation initiation factor [Olivibacter sp. SDN3]QNL51372.1 translation initiation factor [Olivibacter sp. SDN3]
MTKRKKQQYTGIVYSTDENYSYSTDGQDNGDLETLTPGEQQLRVTLDKRQRAGKSVTIVTGFVGRDDDLLALGKLLKNKCGVGGTVKDGQVLIQGDFKVKVATILLNEGYKVKQVGS